MAQAAEGTVDLPTGELQGHPHVRSDVGAAGHLKFLDALIAPGVGDHTRDAAIGYPPAVGAI